MVLRLRADFSVTEIVGPEDHRWVASPEAGVDRVMLDRIGDEVAIATSFVRYRPGSRFAAHVHERGEEFLVLDGVFADEHGDYPAGTYVRNPPGSRHTPRSDPGCTVFVKLRQFRADDLEGVVVDTTCLDAAVVDEPIRLHVLHRFADEEVLLIDGRAGAVCAFAAASVPRELLMLSGEGESLGRRLVPRSWLRVPAGRSVALRFVQAGRAFVKTRPVTDGIGLSTQGRMNS